MIASRFKRVSWKYRGIAYATQLKNCGVLYGNMYLVAESMNLAACALGLGNPTRFARLADCEFYVALPQRREHVAQELVHAGLLPDGVSRLIRLRLLSPVNPKTGTQNAIGGLFCG